MRIIKIAAILKPNDAEYLWSVVEQYLPRQERVKEPHVVMAYHSDVESVHRGMLGRTILLYSRLLVAFGKTVFVTVDPFGTCNTENPHIILSKEELSDPDSVPRMLRHPVPTGDTGDSIFKHKNIPLRLRAVVGALVTCRNNAFYSNPQWVFSNDLLKALHAADQ